MLVPDELDINDADSRIHAALEVIYRFGQIDGDHKTWVIDQVVRALMADDYDDWVKDYEGDPEDEENYYLWDTGICP